MGNGTKYLIVSRFNAMNVRARLTKTTAQNTGGANGTQTIITWQTDTKVNTTYFSHAANSAVVTVLYDGEYNIKCTLPIIKNVNSRITLKVAYRINGGAIQYLAHGSGYSRGSSYGDISPRLDVELDLAANDTVEIVSVVDDTDSASELGVTDTANCQLVIRRTGN